MYLEFQCLTVNYVNVKVITISFIKLPDERTDILKLKKFTDILSEFFINAAKAIKNVVQRIVAWYRALPINDRLKQIIPLVFCAVVLVLLLLVIMGRIGAAGNESPQSQGGSSDLYSVDLASGNENDTYASDDDPYAPGTVSDINDNTLDAPTIAGAAGGQSFVPDSFEDEKIRVLLVSLESCDSFEYKDINDSIMALAAFKKSIYLNDTTVSEDGKIYSINYKSLNASIYNMFGKALKDPVSLTGNLMRSGSTYIHFVDNPGPLYSDAKITGSSSLSGDYIIVDGIVSRGRSFDAGKYSRKIKVILKRNPLATYGYFIIALSNEPTAYTVIDRLENAGKTESDTIPPVSSSVVESTPESLEQSSDNSSAADSSVPQESMGSSTDPAQSSTDSSNTVTQTEHI